MLAQPIETIADLTVEMGMAGRQPSCFDIPGGLRLVMTEGPVGLVPQRAGKLLPPPTIRVGLPLRSGHSRQLLIFRAEAAADPIDLLSRDGQAIGRIEAKDFGLIDRAALTEGLDEAGKVRLARQVLDVCRDLFQLRHDV